LTWAQFFILLGLNGVFSWVIARMVVIRTVDSINKVFREGAEPDGKR
jgi:hypothetical protein